MECATSDETAVFVSQFAADVHHMLEMEDMAGTERREAQRIASPDSTGIGIEPSAASMYFDWEPHHLSRRAGGEVGEDARSASGYTDDEAVASGGTPVAEIRWHTTGDAEVREEDTMESLVREARLERGRLEGYRSGGSTSNREGPMFADHNRDCTDATTARSRLEVSDSRAESVEVERSLTRGRRATQYKRDGIALLPRFSATDIAAMFSAPPPDLLTLREAPNVGSVDERVTGALRHLARAP